MTFAIFHIHTPCNMNNIPLCKKLLSCLRFLRAMAQRASERRFKGVSCFLWPTIENEPCELLRLLYPLQQQQKRLKSTELLRYFLLLRRCTIVSGWILLSCLRLWHVTGHLFPSPSFICNSPLYCCTAFDIYFPFTCISSFVVCRLSLVGCLLKSLIVLRFSPGLSLFWSYLDESSRFYFLHFHAAVRFRELFKFLRPVKAAFIPTTLLHSHTHTHTQTIYT